MSLTCRDLSLFKNIILFLHCCLLHYQMACICAGTSSKGGEKMLLLLKLWSGIWENNYVYQIEICSSATCIFNTKKKKQNERQYLMLRLQQCRGSSGLIITYVTRLITYENGVSF